MAQALIYQKSTVTVPNEETLILDTRQGLLYPIAMTGSFVGSPVNSNWSEIRLGMYFTIVSGSSGSLGTGNNTAGSAAGESLTISSPLDWISFGLKDSQTQTPPGYSGSMFIGVGVSVSNSGVPYRGAGKVDHNNGGNMQAYGAYGTWVTGSTYNLNYMGFPSDPSPSGSTPYCGFYGIKMTLVNSGSSTQQIYVWSQTSTSVTSMNYNTTQLIQDMNNTALNGPYSISWASASVALPIPDAFWIRLPFYTYRIRLSAIAAKRFA